jgi:hypothetical protein
MRVATVAAGHLAVHRANTADTDDAAVEYSLPVVLLRTGDNVAAVDECERWLVTATPLRLHPGRAKLAKRFTIQFRAKGPIGRIEGTVENGAVSDNHRWPVTVISVCHSVGHLPCPAVRPTSMGTRRLERFVNTNKAPARSW